MKFGGNIVRYKTFKVKNGGLGFTSLAATTAILSSLFSFSILSIILSVLFGLTIGLFVTNFVVSFFNLKYIIDLAKAKELTSEDLKGLTDLEKEVIKMTCKNSNDHV